MLKFTIRLLPVIACLWVAGFIGVHAQTDASPTNTPATNAPTATAPTAIALGDIISQAQADSTKMQTDTTELNADTTLQEIGDRLRGLTTDVDNRTAEDAHMLASNPTLNILERSQVAWELLADNIDAAQKDLSQRVSQLDNLLWDLSQMDATWKVTADSAQKINAPPEIEDRIQKVLALIAETTKTVKGALDPLYVMQNRVAMQAARNQGGQDSIAKAVDTARSELLKQDHPPLWNTASLAPKGTSMVIQEERSLEDQFTSLREYLRQKIGAVLVHLFLLAILVMGFYWIRNTIRARAEEKPALKQAEQIFDVPLATSLLVALLATWLLYPEAPRLLWAIAGASALIPAVFVTRRLIDPCNYFILYAAVIAYFVDQVRYVVTQNGVFLRFLFILELLAVTIFIIIALRSKHLSVADAATNRLKWFTRVFLHLAFVVFIFAGFANVFGYVHLSFLVGDGMLESSYRAIVLYALVRIIDAVVVSALSFPPLTSLRMVRHHMELLNHNITVFVRWLVFVFWFISALKLFALLVPLWLGVNQLLWAKVKWFSIPFSLGAVLAFPITVWASFLISRFVRFTLNEEVYPHMQLGRGIPYAASTMLHYIILCLGFFAAVIATGVDLSSFAFLAGAFGVGLGFGMQNIMNNFVSGIILLFERPIKVGDTIQIDANTIGCVERIGIRASVILLTNGSELIVPNGNLISNPVTNWTLSNCERMIEIPVNITSKVDPKHIMDLLVKIAAAHRAVIKNPAPLAFLTAPGSATQAFRLRAWIDSEDEWMKVTSDLSLAINDALAKENITMA